MATEIAVRVENGRLAPIDDVSEETLRGLEGKELMAKLWKPRNLKHNALVFKLLSLIADNHPELHTTEAVLTFIKTELKMFCPKIVTVMVDGQMRVGLIYELRSVSFSTMDQQEFAEFWKHAMRVVTEKLLPGVTNDDIALEIMRYVA
ncbi:MAG: hypothetical protein AB7O57_08350 [Hyphomicrobiaceae bacterium]